MVTVDRFITPQFQFRSGYNILQLYRAPIPGFFIVGRVETSLCNSMLNIPPPIGKDRRRLMRATPGPRRGRQCGYVMDLVPAPGAVTFGVDLGNVRCRWRDCPIRR